MKIKDRVRNKDSFDLEEGKFWHGVIEVLKTGMRAVDEKGHSEWIRLRVEPALLNEVTAAIELLPPGFVKRISVLHKCFYKIGIMASIKSLRDSYGIELQEIEEILDKTILIERELNKIELDKQFKALIMKTKELIKEESNKAEVIDIIETLRKRVINQ